VVPSLSLMRLKCNVARIGGPLAHPKGGAGAERSRPPPRKKTPRILIESAASKTGRGDWI
jgi:hypothetical protein